MLLFVHTIYIEWFGYQRPQITYKQFVMEQLNEIFFLFVIYHMAYLTTMIETWGLDSMVQY